MVIDTFSLQKSLKESDDSGDDHSANLPSLLTPPSLFFSFLTTKREEKKNVGQELIEDTQMDNKWTTLNLSRKEEETQINTFFYCVCEFACPSPSLFLWPLF